VDPPTHILNGFIWGLWGIYDMSIFLSDDKAKTLFNRCVKTLVENLSIYDTGNWSLYEQSGTNLPMLASPFYHNLHIVQCEIMYKLTMNSTFKVYRDKWAIYNKSAFKRKRAFVQKTLFKLFYY